MDHTKYNLCKPVSCSSSHGSWWRCLHKRGLQPLVLRPQIQQTHEDLTSFANQFLISRLMVYPSPLCTTIGKTVYREDSVILWKMICKKEYSVIYISSSMKQALCCHSIFLLKGKIASYEKQLLCNSTRTFLEKQGAGEFTGEIEN